MLDQVTMNVKIMFKTKQFYLNEKYMKYRFCIFKSNKCFWIKINIFHTIYHLFTIRAIGVYSI